MRTKVSKSKLEKKRKYTFLKLRSILLRFQQHEDLLSYLCYEKKNNGKIKSYNIKLIIRSQKSEVGFLSVYRETANE